jgi:RNA polymerase sigma-70 factor (ECF subfamily)
LLELTSPGDVDPEARAILRETIELTFLTALQHLPPRQRAIMVLRDVLDFSTAETAEQLNTSVASVNSAHQRARVTMRAHQPTGPSASATADERIALERFMQAWERADTHALTTLLREDARWAMPPAPGAALGAARPVRRRAGGANHPAADHDPGHLRKVDVLPRLVVERQAALADTGFAAHQHQTATPRSRPVGSGDGAPGGH